MMMKQHRPSISAFREFVLIFTGVVVVVEVLATSWLINGCDALPLDQFFPFGRNAADDYLPSCELDYCCRPLQLRNGLGIAEEIYTKVFVNSNGFVSLGLAHKDHNCIPSSINPSPFPLDIGFPLVAPLWAWVDIGSGNVWFRRIDSQSDQYSLNRLRDIVNTVYYRKMLSVVEAAIITWEGVGYHGLPSDKRNTFQCILFSNGDRHTYVIFLYADENGMVKGCKETYCKGAGQIRAQAGYDIGNGRNYKTIIDSFTNNTDYNSIAKRSNVDVPGMFVFELLTPKYHQLSLEAVYRRQHTTIHKRSSDEALGILPIPPPNEPSSKPCEQCQQYKTSETNFSVTHEGSASRPSTLTVPEQSLTDVRSSTSNSLEVVDHGGQQADVAVSLTAPRGQLIPSCPICDSRSHSGVGGGSVEAHQGGPHGSVDTTHYIHTDTPPQYPPYQRYEPVDYYDHTEAHSGGNPNHVSPSEPDHIEAHDGGGNPASHVLPSVPFEPDHTKAHRERNSTTDVLLPVPSEPYHIKAHDGGGNPASHVLPSVPFEHRGEGPTSDVLIPVPFEPGYIEAHNGEDSISRVLPSVPPELISIPSKPDHIEAHDGEGKPTIHVSPPVPFEPGHIRPHHQLGSPATDVLIPVPSEPDHIEAHSGGDSTSHVLPLVPSEPSYIPLQSTTVEDVVEAHKGGGPLSESPIQSTILKLPCSKQPPCEQHRPLKEPSSYHNGSIVSDLEKYALKDCSIIGSKTCKNKIIEMTCQHLAKFKRTDKLPLPCLQIT